MINDTSTTERLENFVIFPRKIKQDLQGGYITPNEFHVYCYIRISGNPYGMASIGLDDIANCISRGKKVSINYCNKILLSLKSKRYIYYQDRTGRRGSFEIHLGNWMLPNKKIKMLDNFFETNKVRGDAKNKSELHTEEYQNSPHTSQSFHIENIPIESDFSFKKIGNDVRGSYNDTDKENNKIIYRSKKSLKKENIIPLEEFESKDANEYRCFEIAKEIGEKEMNYILSIYRLYGIGIIEEAYSILKDKIRKGGIAKKGGYFNGTIKEIIRRRE